MNIDAKSFRDYTCCNRAEDKNLSRTRGMKGAEKKYKPEEYKQGEKRGRYNKQTWWTCREESRSASLRGNKFRIGHP